MVVSNKFPPSLHNDLQLIRVTYLRMGRKNMYDSLLDSNERRLIELYLQDNSYSHVGSQCNQDELSVYFIIRNAVFKLKLIVQ